MNPSLVRPLALTPNVDLNNRQKRYSTDKSKSGTRLMRKRLRKADKRTGGNISKALELAHKIKTRGGKTIYACPKCRKIFFNDSSCAIHILNRHSEEENLKPRKPKPKRAKKQKIERSSAFALQSWKRVEGKPVYGGAPSLGKKR